MPHSKIKELNTVSLCWVVGFYFWVFFLICTSKDFAPWNVWFASIELAVCKQSVSSRGVFPGEVLLGALLQCSDLYFRDRAVCCPFSTFLFQSLGDFILHLEYAVPPRWFLSA